MIKYIEKYNHYLYYILGLVCFGVFILQRIEGLSLKIGTAFPVVLLPLVITIACFLREWTGFWFGLVSGIALDTVTNGTSCLNTFLFMLIGVTVGLLFRFVLNRNIKSAIIVGFLGSFLYFFIKWLFLVVFTGDLAAISILFKYELPSAIYTGLLIIPCFYFTKWLAAKYLIQKS